MAFLDSVQKVPPKTRVIAFLGFVGLLVVLFIWQIYIPKNDQIKKLDADIAALQAKIRENEAKIRKLDELKAEVRSLNEKLKFLTEQLPPETEVSGLLRQVQRLVNQSGLSLKVWRPDRRRTHPSGLYEEIPISLTLAGSYHNFGMFFDRVSKMTRIVNILNISMGSASRKKDGTMSISVGCTAMTFAAVEKKPDAAPAAKKRQ